MSREEYRARSKKVQKMGRDGLVERDKATGEERRVSQRAADVSFSPNRTEEQAAGHRAVQRGGPAASAKKRRKQPRPIQQTAEEAAYASQSTASVPEFSAPDAPSMRMAVDAPMVAAPTGGEDAPPPPASQRRHKQKNLKKSNQRQAAKYTQDAARPPEGQPAAMRDAVDIPMQDRSTGKEPEDPVKHPPRAAEGGGRLQFKESEGEQPASDGKLSADTSTRAKKQQVRRFAPDAAQPAVTVEHRPSRLMDDGGGRLHFEGADAAAPVSDAEQSADAKRTVKKRQVVDYAANAAQPEDGQQVEQSAPVNDEAHQQDSPQPEPPALDDRAAYKKKQAAKSAADSAVPVPSERRRLQFEDQPPTATADVSASNTQKDTLPPSRKYQKAERRVERAGDKLERAQAKLPTKRRLRLDTEYDANAGKVRRRLRFESEVKPETIRPSLPAQVGRTVKTAAVMKLHGKIRENERDNVALEAAHKAEFSAEWGAGRLLRWNKQRLRSKPYRAVRQAERRLNAKKVDLAWQTALRDNPELRRKNVLSKWIQKQKIKRKYAQAAREAQMTAQHTQQVLTASGKIARAVQRFAAAHKGALLIAALLALTISLFSAGLASCTAMLSGLQTTYLSATYLANEQEITSAEQYFTELETNLQLDIAGTEANYPGYDEYRYSIGDISHNPYELMNYLSAAYGAFTFEQVRPELDRLFGEKYQLTRTEITETRYDDEGNSYQWTVLQTTLTVGRLGDTIADSLTQEGADLYQTYAQTLGNRQAFSNPFDFPWLGYVSSGYGWRVHPTTRVKDLHRGVDIAVAQGTPIKAIQDGRVVSAGNAGSYGLCVVIEDAQGYQSRFAHCSDLNVSAGQEVMRGDVIATVGSTGDSTGPHLHLEVLLNGEYLDPCYFVDTGDSGINGALPGEPGGPVIPDNPGTPMGDDRFQAMLAEAEKYLGFPYVWGGTNPTTSFDCSGYVSWVINHCGVGWNYGRLGVMGLEDICTPVSKADARPGDLVFFIGTYDAPYPNRPTHVGIYVGGGRFIHCGDPISYANLNSSYWQQHYYGMGRLPEP